MGELRSCKITKGLVWHKAELKFGAESVIEIGKIDYGGTLDYLATICDLNAEKLEIGSSNPPSEG